MKLSNKIKAAIFIALLPFASLIASDISSANQAFNETVEAHPPIYIQEGSRAFAASGYIIQVEVEKAKSIEIYGHNNPLHMHDFVLQGLKDSDTSIRVVKTTGNYFDDETTTIPVEPGTYPINGTKDFVIEIVEYQKAIKIIKSPNLFSSGTLEKLPVYLIRVKETK